MTLSRMETTVLSDSSAESDDDASTESAPAPVSKVPEIRWINLDDRQVYVAGEGPLAANVIFGRIHVAHVADSVLGENGKPDPARLDLIGRMGGETFTRTRERFDLIRP